MSIEFRERPTSAYDFQVEVRKSGVLLGHVRRTAKGVYQYYRGPLNELTYEFEDTDLGRLKSLVVAREEASPLTY